MNKKDKIKVIWTGDWEVIYINDKKVFSGHSADSLHWLKFLENEFSFDVEDVEVDEDEMYQYEQIERINRNA